MRRKWGQIYDDYGTESDSIHFLSLNHEVLFRINGYWNFIPKNGRWCTWAKRKIQSIFYKLKEGDTHHEITYWGRKGSWCCYRWYLPDFEKKNIIIKINKASSIMAVIRRSFVLLNGVNFVPLYKSLVRSHFEYMPWYGHHMKKSIL